MLGWLGCLNTRNNFAFFDLSYILHVDTKFCPNQTKIGKVSILGWVRGVKWFWWLDQKYNFLFELCCPFLTSTSSFIQIGAILAKLVFWGGLGG